MAMLTLNGIVIPTKFGGQISNKDIGDPDGEAFDGSAQIDIRGRKRHWKFTTIPISAATAKMLRGLIQGNGFYFSFDTSTAAAGGRAPSAVAANIMGNLATDGSTVSDNVSVQVNGVNGLLSYSKYGAGSVQVDQGATNLMSAAQSQGTAGWTALGGGTVTLGDATHSWESTTSAKYVSAGLAGAQAAVTTTYAAGDRLIASVFVWVAAGYTDPIQLQISGTNITTANISYAASFLNKGGWTRLGVFATCTGAGTTANVLVANGGVSTPTFWIDGAMLEKRLSGAIDHNWSAWVIGGVARATGFIQYAANVASNQGFTFNCWVCNPGSILSGVPNGALFSATGPTLSGAVNCITVSYRSGTLLFQTFGAGGGTGFLNPTLTLSTTAWTMLTFVLDTSNFSYAMYVNGNLASLASGGAAGFPFAGAMSGLSFLNIGSAFNGDLTWGSRIDEVEVLPYPVTSAWVTQRYTATVAPVGPPLLLAAGVSIDDPLGVVVQGRATDEQYVGFQNTASWGAENRTLEITLREV